MKTFFANLGVNLVALASLGAAFYLLLHDKDGWGWFMFLAFCCSATIKLKSE